MKFEVLKRSHLKRNIIIGVFAVFIISACILNFTQAKYRVTESIPLINGTIHYTPYDLNLVAMYQQDEAGEYVEIEQMPSSGYTINTEESYCTVDGNKDNTISLYTNENGEHVIAKLKKGSKCYLYFDKCQAKDVILAGKDIQKRTDFSTVLTTNTDGIIYQEETSDGTTYYFAGDTDENWVSFAGYYWQIIRINEDESVRLIYAGTSPSMGNTDDQISASAFNNTVSDNAHIGYMFGSLNASNYNLTHSNINSSTIKAVIDNWYQKNILNANYDRYINTEAGFCGDRTPYVYRSGLYISGGGTGTIATYYGAFVRLNINKIPTFECNSSNDLYTVDESSKGLTYPVGLITADEVVYAGGTYKQTNNSFYLNTDSTYWTLSPFEYDGDSSRIFYVSEGYLNDWHGSYDAFGVRPVINLDAGVTIKSGNGTANSPYKIS